MGNRGSWTLLRRLKVRGSVAVLTLTLGAVAGCPVTSQTECVTNADCDDGKFCNGEEYCSVDENDVMRCYDRENPCMNPVGCNDETDTCELDP